MRSAAIVAVIFVMLNILACKVSSDRHDSSPSMNQNHHPSMKGVCWVGGDSISHYNFDDLTSAGSNWISQTPFAFQPDIYGPELRMNTDRAWWGETDRGIAHTTQLAKQHGVKVMLKPHIWLRTDDGKWRSDIAMKNEADWQAWFANYEIMIMHYAKLAERHQIESLCIGAELYQTTKQHPEKWRAMIKRIRSVYSGQLTYAANWYQEYEELSFWDALDYIGIQAYFPLSNSENPSKAELKSSWRKYKKSILKVSEKYNKKVVFTEIGYKNTADSAKEPWTWPQNMDKATVVASNELQVTLYEAMFESLYHEEWVDGFFIWKWFHTTYKYKDFKEYLLAREARFDSLRRVRKWRDRPKVYFTPQHTPALDILTLWYTKHQLSS